MKYLLLILSHFIFSFAGAQQITAKQGTDDFKVWLISFDTSKVKVYNGDKIKYDTTGPQLRLVSDTAHDHWNGVSAMWIYEVVTIESSYGCDKCPPRFVHFCWLGSKKKPFNLKVWEDKQ